MKLALIRRRGSSTGGAELYLSRLMEALVEREHEVHLFAEAWDGLPERVAFHRVEVDGGRSVKPRRFAEAVQEKLQGMTFDCVFSLERTLKQDVYRAGDGLHRVWLERRRAFAPWWKHFFVGWGGFHRTMRNLEAETFDPKNTRHVIVNSEMVRSEILEHFSFPPDRIHLVRNGVAVERFRSGNREAARKRFGLSSEDFVLLFVGSGWERKGLPVLLRAMEELGAEGIKLLVVGKGRRPRRVPEGVVFAGSMPDVEVAYAAADLFVFPAIYEPCANVVAESLTSGVPVVTSRQNGASELLAEGVNGTILKDPADVVEVVAAIRSWKARGPKVEVTCDAPLDLETNVEATLKILEMAAGERA